jgi:hypothetical protein
MEEQNQPNWIGVGGGPKGGLRVVVIERSPELPLAQVSSNQRRGTDCDVNQLRRAMLRKRYLPRQSLRTRGGAGDMAHTGPSPTKMPARTVAAAFTCEGQRFGFEHGLIKPDR